MSKLSILVLILAVVTQCQAFPADPDMAADAAPAVPVPKEAPKEAAPKEAAAPSPDCIMFVGTNERKLKPGCQICWAPPEFITCKDGDWAFGSCGEGMKCTHTSECTTTCVPRPVTQKPAVHSESASGNNTLARCRRNGFCPFAQP